MERKYTIKKLNPRTSWVSLMIPSQNCAKVSKMTENWYTNFLLVKNDFVADRFLKKGLKTDKGPKYVFLPYKNRNLVQKSISALFLEFYSNFAFN